MSKVKANDAVKVHYVGKLSNGQVFDSSLEREPLEVTLGQDS
jgi:FKBP-type peptidyl-prolyl cis-trans isomerase